jgi:hypothetical protein
MRYLLAKLYYWLALCSTGETQVGYLDRSHDLDPRADPHFHPGDYSDA